MTQSFNTARTAADVMQPESLAAMRIAQRELGSVMAQPDIQQKLTSIAARLAACLWDFHSTCPECGNSRARHMPGCNQTYEREFRGPQDTERVFALAFGISPHNESDYYVHRNSGRVVFVKSGAFFEQQGGLKDDWGKHWTKVRATSLEHARAIGEATLP